jgi:hypothetical protein
MMIAHDHRNSGGLETSEPGSVRRAAIHRNEQPRFLLERPVDGAIGHAVTVLATVRHEAVHSLEDAVEVVIQQRGAGDAVDVVVAMNQKRGTRARRGIDHGDRFAHVLEKKRIVRVFHTRRKKGADRRGVCHRTCSE